jgi:hypothetical protein
LGGESPSDYTGIELIVGPTIGQDDPEKRLVVVLTCYLDDAGTDPQSPLVVLAGYVGPYQNWVLFEGMARPVLEAEGVSFVHGKELYQTKSPFAGWRMARKHAFVAALQDKLQRAAFFGINFAIMKGPFEDAKERGGESAFGLCFRATFDAILRARRVTDAIKSGQKISFVIEQGNKNNNDVLRIYNEMVFKHEYGSAFGGLSFAKKNSTISLQMADLLAYYMKRYANACIKARTYIPEPDMVKILFRGKIPITGIVGKKFETVRRGTKLFETDTAFRYAENLRETGKGGPFDDL